MIVCLRMEAVVVVVGCLPMGAVVVVVACRPMAVVVGGNLFLRRYP
jgi:hypothetical protein